MTIVGIDPGKTGALVALGEDFKFLKMPFGVDCLDYDSIAGFLHELDADLHVYLERAVPMAMGSKAAFSYGRDFGMLELMLKLDSENIPVTYVEPTKWVKEMCEGIDSRLRPKERSILAVTRLFPKHVDAIPRTPKSKKMHEGIVDALLIAGYGKRKLGMV